MSKLPRGVVPLAGGGGPHPPPPPPPLNRGPVRNGPPPPPANQGVVRPAPPVGARHPGPPAAPHGGGPPPPGAFHPVAPMPMALPVAVLPPKNLVPREMLEKQLVEVSDLRRDRMTEADAREALSSYIVYRFEKVQDPNETDSEGIPVKPTWENVRRVQVPDLSQKDIKRAICDLNYEGRTALDRKADLTANQQLQIEKVQSALEARELDRRFCHTLQQISPKMRKIRSDSLHYRQCMADKEGKKVVIAKGKTYVSKEKRSKKTLLETVSLTVYFKREPSAGQNALDLYKVLKTERETNQHREMAQKHHEAMMQRQQYEHNVAMAMRDREEAFRAQMMPPQPPPRAGPPPSPRPGPPPPMGGKPGKPPKVLTNSSHGSSSSASSSGSDSGTDLTPNSSVTDSSESTQRDRPRHRHRHRSRSHSRSHSRSRGRNRSRSRSRNYYASRPEDHGHMSPRRHVRYPHDHLYIPENDLPRGRLMAAPVSPVALPMGGAYVGEDLYAVPRRIASRPEAYGDDGDGTLDAIFNRRRTAPQPRIIQRDLNFRTVGAQEVARQRHEDDLDNFRRLQLEDEVRYEDDWRREEYRAAERDDMERRGHRQMENRFRRPSLDRDILFQTVTPDTYEEEAARSYMRRSERRAGSPYNNPFDALGRGARRSSFGYRG
ncbi:hypothetical protein C8034_v002471 [Colletotrichum sidae]|uniref:Uncharacterized protein n=1 Tax=Colletotrichum sidae TaxID=1347389 RepID=A0A4R8TC42_9PEZI|nr:hypothetical protein C8034_v002471 [Colletotrichum sidae]